VLVTAGARSSPMPAPLVAFGNPTFLHVSSPRIQRQSNGCNRSTPRAVAADAQQPAIPAPAALPPLTLYNSMSRLKEQFSTVEPGVVRLYSCGPTVYDYAHIGNFRAFLTYDLVKRWLTRLGYTVRHVMNLTDVDDKIIRRVAASHGTLTAQELTDRYADAFFKDLALLNVIPADVYPRATQHIEEIAEVVAGLRRRGIAYESGGSTYFSVAAFPAYGRLAQLEKRAKGGDKNSVGDAEQSAASDNDEYGKDDARDFALWKAYKPEDGNVFWIMPELGKGRPGWHIECTCMAIKYLGPELDIHAGGVDLVFPHHENEIAQAEAHTGRPFARFWLHNGFVNIDNEKMSKSLGNFRTLRDIARKPNDARAFRYLVMSSQYRSALAFTEPSLNAARSTVKRLDTLRARLQEAVLSNNTETAKPEHLAAAIEKARFDFTVAMNDDLNTPRAAAAMFSLVKVAESLLKSDAMGKDGAAHVLACMDDFDHVFGIFYSPVLEPKSEPSCKDEATCPEITPDLEVLLEERKSARLAKDWGRADEIRNRFAAAGFTVVDTPSGPQLKSTE
jgi:cysteinyl-tRNA synthetase